MFICIYAIPYMKKAKYRRLFPSKEYNVCPVDILLICFQWDFFENTGNQENTAWKKSFGQKNLQSIKQEKTINLEKEEL